MGVHQNFAERKRHSAQPPCLRHPPILKYAKWGERLTRRLHLRFKQTKWGNQKAREAYFVVMPISNKLIREKMTRTQDKENTITVPAAGWKWPCRAAGPP
jgi:hypothetical protein